MKKAILFFIIFFAAVFHAGSDLKAGEYIVLECQQASDCQEITNKQADCVNKQCLYSDIQQLVDNIAPSVSNIKVASITANSAVITWSTNEPSISWLAYGLTSSYKSELKTSSFKNSHSLSLTELSPDTLYHYKIKTKDRAGNAGFIMDKTFRTLKETNNGNRSSFNVSLTALPSFGQAPLNNVDLKAVVSGESGNINYTFYCDRGDNGLNITTPYSAKRDNVSQNVYTLSDACDYASAGTYTAKTIAERGSAQAEARTTITVSSPDKSLQNMTIPELQAKIAEILSAIALLQNQLNQLQGGGNSISGIPVGFKFERNLKFGQNLKDVKYLQIFLNSDPDTRVAQRGWGSPGYETFHFGYLTGLAVIRFQEKYASEILTPWRLTKGSGFVGPTTRKKINNLLGR